MRLSNFIAEVVSCCEVLASSLGVLEGLEFGPLGFGCRVSWGLGFWLMGLGF